MNYAFYIIFAVLAYLILKKSDWENAIDFSIVIGSFISLLAVFQFYGLFGQIFTTISFRPASTAGNPIMLQHTFFLYFSLRSRESFQKILNGKEYFIPAQAPCFCTE